MFRLMRSLDSASYLGLVIGWLISDNLLCWNHLTSYHWWVNIWQWLLTKAC